MAAGARGRDAGIRLPASTYRVQLHAGFTFDDLRAALPYLDELGVGDVYASPIFRSRTGSAHGYDQCDPTEIDPELGGEPTFAELVGALRERSMGLLVDIVPNHMAASAENPWWWDVLARGPASPHAAVFDIDWEAADGKIVLPVLGLPYGTALERGEIRLARGEDAEPHIAYHEARFPVSAGTAGEIPSTPTANELDRLLRAQHYRLAFWRSGSRELNYRRFFDVTELVCVRQEDRDVFAATHRRVLELVEDGSVTGLRVDHVDGLRDPTGYLERLRAELPRRRAYVVVEKILARGEELPQNWPVSGTVGYEFCNALGGIFVDPSGAAALERHAGCAGFGEVALECKRTVIRHLFAGELERLSVRFRTIARDGRHGRDLSREDFEVALTELTAQLDVYRTYIRSAVVGGADRVHLDRAFTAAKACLPEHRRYALDVIERMTHGPSGPALDALRSWQQLTGPAMAKGFEDTALYVWPPLQSRNEVGGDPARPAVAPEELHALNARRLQRWPGALNTTSTHDSKRSEDVRARLDVLSEIPDVWTPLVDRWRRRHAAFRTGGVPDAVEELYVYQSIVGAWPYTARERRGLPARVKRYIRKAAREAKVHTSWRDPDAAHERALLRFVDRVFGHAPFVADVERLVERIARPGATNSLAGVVVKIAAPGVPDVYQGAETWHLRLVDPDNRGPVDLERLARLLATLEGADPAELLAGYADGRIKLLITARALRLRRSAPELFARGDYLPLPAAGRRSRHVFAFARRRGDAWAVAVVPRLVASVAGRRFAVGAVWERTTVNLPRSAPTDWRDVVTGAEIASPRGVLRLPHVLGNLPVALLTAER